MARKLNWIELLWTDEKWKAEWRTENSWKLKGKESALVNMDIVEIGNAYIHTPLYIYTFIAEPK